MLRVAGLTVIVKSGTRSLTKVLRLVAPLVPVICSEYVPGAMLAAVVIVSTAELPPPAKLQLACAAVRPLRESATDPVKPFARVMVMVYCAEPPAAVDTTDGVAASEKSGVAASH